VLAAFVIAVWGIEVRQRLELGSDRALLAATGAPEARAAFSDRLSEDLGRPGKIPISLAYVEVQSGYWLDD
jgi:hypothetical protein